jgi:CHASE3 domain sensor protein
VTDRLQELRRQRALVQQHLAWLDGAIAAAESAAGALPSARPVPADAAPAESAPPATPEEAEALAHARAEAANSPAAAKRGCWVVFFGAFVLLFAAIAVWFVVRYGIGTGP